MKQLCVITTGGTIDSVATGDSLSVTDTASGTLTGLLDTIIAGRASYDILSPVNRNSEDFSLHDIEAIAATVAERASEGCRDFLITHGSDTLHFTAAALGLLFAGQDIAICLVAAFQPLFRPGSDGPDNLKAAADLLLADGRSPSTYVALKADIDAVPVVTADWRAVKPLDFDSTGMEALAGPFSPLPAMTLSHRGLGAQSPGVRLIHAYVGLDSQVLQALGATADVIIIGAYHSGTLPSSDDPARGVTTFLTTHPETLVMLARHPDRAEGYASVKRFEAAGGLVIRHLLPHQVYMLACLMRASGYDTQEMRQALIPLSEVHGNAT